METYLSVFQNILFKIFIVFPQFLPQSSQSLLVAKHFREKSDQLQFALQKNTERISCVSCLHCFLHLFCSTIICILRLQTQYTIRFIFRYLKNHVKLKIKQSLYNSLEWWWQSAQKQLGKIYGIMSIKILRLTRALTLESFLRPSVSSQF